MLVEPINWDIGPTFNVRKLLLGNAHPSICRYNFSYIQEGRTIYKDVKGWQGSQRREKREEKEDREDKQDVRPPDIISRESQIYEGSWRNVLLGGKRRIGGKVGLYRRKGSSRG